jgi:hypothetical protein
MSSPIEDEIQTIKDEIQTIKDNQISEINLQWLEIDDHWAGKIAEALKVNYSLQSIYLSTNDIGETLLQEINNYIERNVANFKF